MSDKRFFAKIDVGYLDNPKVGDLVDDHKGAVLLHLRAILYCRQHLTDGVFPIVQVARLAASSYCGGQCTQECTVHSNEQCTQQCTGLCDWCVAVHAGLLHRVDDRFGAVHDYLEHQESAQKVADRSAARQRAANKRWEDERRANSDAPGNASCIAPSSAPSYAEERRGEEREQRAPRDADASPEPAATRPDVEALCVRLADRIEANDSKRPTINKTWRNNCRLILDVDGRDPRQVEQIIDWCQQDPFWRSNVMSMRKLREKYDTLRLQAARDLPRPEPARLMPTQGRDGVITDDHGTYHDWWNPTPVRRHGRIIHDPQGRLGEAITHPEAEAS